MRGAVMRCLIRNKRIFFAALLLRTEPVRDEYGNETGESRNVYGEPFEVRGNISAARGELSTRQFGENEGYDRVIVLDDPNCEIDEYSVLWIDSTPDGGAPYDHIVKKAARSLNSVSLAVAKVNVR